VVKNCGLYQTDPWIQYRLSFPFCYLFLSAHHTCRYITCAADVLSYNNRIKNRYVLGLKEEYNYLTAVLCRTSRVGIDLAMKLFVNQTLSASLREGKRNTKANSEPQRLLSCS
jgi:hypothetical protein